MTGNSILQSERTVPWRAGTAVHVIFCTYCLPSRRFWFILFGDHGLDFGGKKKCDSIIISVSMWRADDGLWVNEWLAVYFRTR